MAKAKPKYDIKYSKDINGCNQGSVKMQLADGSIYQLHYAVNPECKVRSAKPVINDYFNSRIPEFITENPGAICIAWDD